MRHIGKKHCLRIARHLRGMQGFRQLPVMYLPFRLPLSSDPSLLALVKIIQHTAQEKGDQHHSHHDKDILVYGFSFLLDRLDRHIADQVNRSIVHRPHIIQSIFFPDIVIKQNIFPVFHAFSHFRLEVFLHNIICPVKILQIQMPGIPLPHSLWFQHQPFALRVHNIEHGPSIIKSVRKRLIQRIINILHIKRCDLLSVLYDGTFHRISPRSHIIQIGLRNRKPFHASPRRKIQLLFWKALSRIGNAYRFPCRYHWYFYHRLVFFIGADKFFRIFYRGDFLCHQLLELRFFYQNRLNCSFHQIQAFTQILNGRRGHFPGNFLRHWKYNSP